MNENEKEKLETTGQGQTEEVQYLLDQIEEMKQNYVPRSELNKQKAMTKQVMEAYTKGKELDLPTKGNEKKDVQKLRNELYGKDSGKLNSVEYIQKTLDLRNALIEAGERDPFIPVGNHAETTTNAIETAERVAIGLQEMIDFAEGDEGIFLAEYQRRVTDPKIPVGARKRK
ncbi:MAG: hypothetical protein IKU67_01420 [Firmicutes bacterium]|nr:hypothetical protein [Bacillota bacterium]